MTTRSERAREREREREKPSKRWLKRWMEDSVCWQRTRQELAENSFFASGSEFLARCFRCFRCARCVCYSRLLRLRLQLRLQLQLQLQLQPDFDSRASTCTASRLLLLLLLPLPASWHHPSSWLTLSQNSAWTNRWRSPWTTAVVKHIGGRRGMPRIASSNRI